MTDYISREAAIDALERTKEKDPKGDIACFYNTITDNKIAVIEALPSAQPDREPSEWLHDLLQDAIDAGIITEVQAVRIMERVKA